jgi:hypothetical protein
MRCHTQRSSDVVVRILHKLVHILFTQCCPHIWHMPCMYTPVHVHSHYADTSIVTCSNRAWQAQVAALAAIVDALVKVRVYTLQR